MDITTFNFHTDPSHGWLEVSVSGVESVGLKSTDFSDYSYRSGNTLYLEEDCDATKFINELHRRGIAFRLREINENKDSFVRYLNRIY